MRVSKGPRRQTAARGDVFRSWPCALFLLGLMLGGANPRHVAGQVADLAIVKSDGSSTAVPGTTVTYNIVVTNAGPDPVFGAIVTDDFPPVLLGVVWSCSPSPGSACTPSGSGNLADSVDLPPGGTVSYVVSATIDPGAVGTLSNTANVAPPSGVVDPDLSNNSSTDTNTLTPSADLGITKTNFTSSSVPGTAVSYSITVFNNGPSNVSAAEVIDLFPPELRSVSWTCTATPGSSCTPSGVGDIVDAVNLRASGAVTYSVYALVDSSATGFLVNTASVFPPSGVSDPGPALNSATDVDELTPVADIAVSKESASSSVTAGLGTTYQIIVTNAGPSDAPDTEVRDIFPAELSSVTWSCVGTNGASCPAQGSGDIDELVDLPAGSSLRFHVVATVDTCASGSVTNVAEVYPGASVTDPDLSNNTAVDSDAIEVRADLILSVDDSPDPVLVCNTLNYEVTVQNNGPSCATGITVNAVLPPGVDFVATDGSCTLFGNSLTCEVADLEPGEENGFTVTGMVDRALRGAVTSAQVTVSALTSDPVVANNGLWVATEVKPKDPYVVTMTAAPTYLRIGGASTAQYRLRVKSLCDPAVLSSDLILRSVFSPNLVFRSASPLPDTVTPDGAEFTVASVNGGESVTVRIEADLGPDAQPGEELVHSVFLADSLGLGGRVSRTLYVRPLPDTPGPLSVTLAVPKKVAAGALLPARLVIDNKAMLPAENVVVILVLPAQVSLLSSVPEPHSQRDFVEIRELEWFFPSIKRKQVIRLWQQVPPDLHPEETLNFVARAEDAAGNSASNRRDVTIRSSPRDSR